MKPTKYALTAALALLLAGGLATGTAFADLPKKDVDIKAIDTNKDGKIQREEYLAFMGKEFDKTAGAKGYCTFAEVKQGFETPWNAWLNN